MVIRENRYFIFGIEKTVSAKHIALQFAAAVYCSVMALLQLVSKKPVWRKKRYRVSLCAIFKNEGRYLKEWLDYHTLVGVDHFYLYNNNSEDGFRKVLEPYIRSGKVTLIEWKKDHAQLEAYRDCVERFGGETGWVGFIDLDEFVCPRKMDTVYDFLKRFNRTSGAVLIYWKIFGSSGRNTANPGGYVTEDYFVSWDKLCDVGKCFFNTAYDFRYPDRRNRVFHHLLWTESGGLRVPPRNIFGHLCTGGYHPMNSKEPPIQINHYMNKSAEEYAERISKGDALFYQNRHSFDSFFETEQRCISADYSAYRYLVRLKRMGDPVEGAGRP